MTNVLADGAHTAATIQTVYFCMLGGGVGALLFWHRLRVKGGKAWKAGQTPEQRARVERSGKSWPGGAN